MLLKNRSVEDFIPLTQVEVAEIFPKYDGAAILVVDGYYYVALLKEGVSIYPIIQGTFIEWCTFDYFVRVIYENFGSERGYKLLMEFQGVVPD